MNAERLFSETNNFRYVALAIGANPVRPPSWAIEACIEERLTAERSSSGGQRQHTSRILDLAIALMATHEDEYFSPARSLKDEESRIAWYELSEVQYKAKPLVTALRQALLSIDPHEKLVDAAIVNLRNAWMREQKEESLNEENFSVLRLRKIKTTARIDRVLRAMEEWKSASDSPLSADPELLVWDAMRHGLLSP